MSDNKNAAGKGAADLEDLARRFQDLWRDQLAATAADPEFMEMMGKWMAAFAPGGGTAPAAPGVPPATAAGAINPAAWMAAMQTAMAGGVANGGIDDGTSRATQAGPAAPADASGAGHLAGDELERRLAAIERRLDRLEAAVEEPGRATAKRSRSRRS